MTADGHTSKSSQNRCTVCGLIILARRLGIYWRVRDSMMVTGPRGWGEATERRSLVRALLGSSLARGIVKYLLRPCPDHRLLALLGFSWEPPVRENQGDAAPPSAQGAKEVLSESARLALSQFLNQVGVRLKFPNQEMPAVSVVLVTYNKAEYTFRCLESIRAFADVPYEIIIADNASADDMPELLSRLDGVTIIKNETNLGFGHGCNQGALKARAKYLLFLNNDTTISPGSFSALVRTLEERPDVGAVGGKIVLVDGTLQEAGSILWADGSTLGYGRGRDPSDPEFSYLREVDYCSGVCLMVRRDAFEKLGGFDDRYAPAYYEDCDLCLGLADLGWRVIYQPEAVIFHHEHGSSSATDAMLLMQQNRIKFVEKWGSALEGRESPSGRRVLWARVHSKGRRVLVVDDRIPGPDMGSGYPRMYALLRSLAELQYQVTLFPLQDPTPRQPHLRQLQQWGIEVLCGQRAFESLADERAGYYDLLLVSRPHNLWMIHDSLRKHFPGVPLIYDAEALFSFREEAKARLSGKPRSADADRMRRNELSLIRLSDRMIMASELERRYVCELLPELKDRVHVWSHPINVRPTPRSFEERADLLFVGAFPVSGSPNEDAILHFLREIFPEVQHLLGCRLFVIGADPPETIRRYSSESVKVLGFVPDLMEYYDRCRAFIVPHRFSAGISLKLLEAMGQGLPAVVSSLIGEQLSLVDGREALVGGTVEEFRTKLLRLYGDAALWWEIRRNGLQYVREHHDEGRLRESLRSIVEASVPRERSSAANRPVEHPDDSQQRMSDAGIERNHVDSAEADAIRSRPYSTCILCGAEGDPLYEGLRDRLFGAPGLWNLKQCPVPECGLIWLDPIPIEEDIAKAYRNYYTHSEASLPKGWDLRRFRYKLDDYAAYPYLALKYGYYSCVRRPRDRWWGLLMYFDPGRRANLDQAVMFLPAQPGGALLEVGCGNGYSVKLMQDLGWRAEGVEVDAAAVAQARSKGLEVRHGTLEAQGYANDRFDAITMSHVIEHVHAPLRLLQECHRILKPGGRLVMVTPNSESWGHAFFKESWLALDPPRHLHIFNLRTLRRLTERAGFRRLRAASTVRAADDLFIASRSIRRVGSHVWGHPGTLSDQLWAVGMQTLESGMLKIKPGLGEEITLIATK